MAVAVDSYRRFSVPPSLEGVAEHAWVARHDGARHHVEVLLPDGRGLLHASIGLDPAMVVTIDMRTWTVVGRAEAGFAAGAVEVDSATGSVYATDGDNDVLLVLPGQ